MRSILFIGIFFPLMTVFSLHPGRSHAQSIIGYLELTGKTKKNDRELAGAKISLYKNSRLEKELITGKNGKFKFYIDFGSDYKVIFTYPGCVDMHLLVFAKIPKEKYSIMPFYELGDVPFFDTASKSINISKFEKPFTKIVFDGNKAFMDDENYLDDFVKEIYVDPMIAAKAEAERIAKAKAEERAKREAEEKAKTDAETRLKLAEQRAREEARLKAEELARLKTEEEERMAALARQSNQSMTEDDIRLLQEKETKAAMEKKNKSIKSDYENTLIKIVAENEKLVKQKDFEKQKTESQTNSVIEQIRIQAELKAKADPLQKEEILKNRKNLVHQQVKTRQEKNLMEAAAFAELSVKITGDKTEIPDVRNYRMKNNFNVVVSVKEELFKTIKITNVTSGEKLDSYRKETYVWGLEYYYKNDVEIDAVSYKEEFSKFTVLQ